MLHIKLFSQVDIVFFFRAAHELCVDYHHGGKTKVAHAKVGHSGGQVDKISSGEVTPLQLFLDKNEGRKASDYGAVKIKNSGNFRASGEASMSLSNCLILAILIPLLLWGSIAHSGGLGVGQGKSI